MVEGCTSEREIFLAHVNVTSCRDLISCWCSFPPYSIPPFRLTSVHKGSPYKGFGTPPVYSLVESSCPYGVPTFRWSPLVLTMYQHPLEGQSEVSWPSLHHDGETSSSGLPKPRWHREWSMWSWHPCHHPLSSSWLFIPAFSYTCSPSFS